MDAGEDDDRRDGKGPREAEARDGAAPVVESVRIAPGRVYVDGPVECTAEVTDADSDRLDVTYTWRNVTRDRSLGTGAAITLDPDDIAPGETLRCEVRAEDRDGNAGTGRATVEPSCGFYDADSLADVNVSIHIIFRPYKTDDLLPGYEGEPWDWDGDIPDWITDLVDMLEWLADGLAWVYPDPAVLTAAEALDYAQDIIDLMEEYGPGLFAASVPPDPNAYPYMFDDEGELYGFDGVGDGLSWEDSYEVDLALTRADLRDVALAIDFEDYDLAFDDNMGDWLDQDSVPLALGPSVFLDGAYCTSTFYNPSSDTLYSDISVVPSSILWMEIEVW